MPRSHLEQLPEGFGYLAKLRLMDLSDSQNLIKTPNFVGLPSLERLIFRGCTRLHDLHPSVGALKRLTLLNLKDCKSLNSLPLEIKMKSLEIFILSGCVRLKKFSEIGTNMTRLSELYLDGTALEELPLSIEHLTGLTLLSLKDCKNISCSTRVNLPSLETLNLSGYEVVPWNSPQGFNFLHFVTSEHLGHLREAATKGIDSGYLYGSVKTRRSKIQSGSGIRALGHR
nr:isoform 1 of protein suppressor of npr1-1, constitutive 1 [Quercus suber]